MYMVQRMTPPVEQPVRLTITRVRKLYSRENPFLVSDDHTAALEAIVNEANELIARAQSKAQTVGVSKQKMFDTSSDKRGKY